jgi:hypothetical protein
MTITARELAEKLAGTLFSDNRTVTHLASPDSLSADAVVVIPDDKTLSKLEGKELALLVISGTTHAPL